MPIGRPQFKQNVERAALPLSQKGMRGDFDRGLTIPMKDGEMGAGGVVSVHMPADLNWLAGGLALRDDEVAGLGYLLVLVHTVRRTSRSSDPLPVALGLHRDAVAEFAAY